VGNGARSVSTRSVSTQFNIHNSKFNIPPQRLQCRRLKTIIVYTDGACSGNPGPGGWGAILIFGDTKKELFGGEPHTTNNRMEMMGAIRALEALKEPCHVHLHSDSAYLINCFKNRWYANWQRNGWKNSAKQPVENRDLWERLLELASKHRIEWIKVKGHSNDALNNRADELARAGASGRRSEVVNAEL
jgi:ribonuclease HI